MPDEFRATGEVEKSVGWPVVTCSNVHGTFDT